MRCYPLNRWHDEPSVVVETPKPPPMLRPEEAAHRLGVTVAVLLRYARQPDGPEFCQYGPRVRRYPREALDAWLEQARNRGRTEKTAA